MKNIGKDDDHRRKLSAFWGILLLIGFMFLTGCGVNKQNDDVGKSTKPNPVGDIAFNPPKLEDIKDDEMGKSIKLGFNLINESNKYMSKYIGNKISCSSCHINAGREKILGFVGTASQYPQYRDREGVIFSLEDRINGCMKRSMNGKVLPYDSVELTAMDAYITWLSRGIPMGIVTLPWGKIDSIDSAMNADPKKGEEPYNQKCAACHGKNGEGIGALSGPAVWGPNSFNNSAGLSRVTKLAGFIKTLMPKGQPGTLNDEEAGSIAKYILSHDRPHYSESAKDWPNGKNPADVPYPVESDKK